MNKRFGSHAAHAEAAGVEENSLKLPFYDSRIAQHSSVEILQKEAHVSSTPIKTQLKNGFTVVSTVCTIFFYTFFC